MADPSDTSVFRRVTSRLRPLPDFLIVGAMKAGTTSLYHDLLRHPQVLAATQKELHYFDPDKIQRGPEWYRAQFASLPYRTVHHAVRRHRPITGEASPSYLLYPHAAAQAAELVPDARIIVLLREPVSRALSMFQHQRRNHAEPLPTFAESIDAEEARLDGEWEKLVADPHRRSYAMKKFSYVRRGEYLPQLLRWETAFGRERVLVLHTDDFQRDPSSILRQVARFLDIPDWEPAARRRNVSSNLVTMEPAIRERLTEHFRPHNRALFDHLGVDLGWPA